MVTAFSAMMWSCLIPCYICGMAYVTHASDVATTGLPDTCPCVQYKVRLGTLLFSEMVPERASQSCCHGIPSSTEGFRPDFNGL